MRLYDLENHRPTIFDAMLPARLPPEKAEPARFDAWLNLSQREKARVFMIVKMSAIAWPRQHIRPFKRSWKSSQDSGRNRGQGEAGGKEVREHTDKRHPQELQPDKRNDRHDDPHDGLHVHGQPEEARVRRVDHLGPRLAALKHPPRVARGVDLVPPAQPHETAAGDVLGVVEVRGEEEHCDDEG